MDQYMNNIQPGAVLLLTSVPELKIEAQQNTVRISVCRKVNPGNYAVTVFSTVLSLSQDEDKYSTIFFFRDIIESYMRSHALTFADFRIEYGVPTDEQPDFRLDFSVIHNIIDSDVVHSPVIAANRVRPFFLPDFVSKIMNRDSEFEISVISTEDFYFSAIVTFIDGESVTLQSRYQQNDLSQYNHLFKYQIITRQIISAAEKSAAEISGNARIRVAARIDLILKDKSDSVIEDRLTVWLDSKDPSAEITYINQFLCPETLQFFDQWKQKTVNTSSVANVGGQQAAYDYDTENEITISSHPVDSITASRLLMVGLTKPEVKMKLSAGSMAMSVTGIITKSEIEICPEDKDMSRLKLTVNPGKYPAPFIPRKSVFTGHFTNQFF